MGFGGGAFGTGSYTYSVIDDETIKLNQQKGVIYANQSALSPATDNNTIYLNSSNQLAVKPSTINVSQSSYQNITISSNTTLTSDLYCNNLTINSGVVLTTNGHNIYCLGTFTNNGTINTGYTPFQNFSNSYGGSGGGGGSTSTNNYTGYGGYSTLVTGGSGGNASNGGNGSTPTAPTLSNSTIQNWYNNGLSNYLAGAGGGNGGAENNGGAGAYGIYIQANQIIAGTINANGQSGGSVSSFFGGGGGGGGGTILLAYGSGGYTAGTYNVSGGAGGSGGYAGGSGGNGQILTYNYSIQPIFFGKFSATITAGTKNRNSTFNYSVISTTSTSPQTLISQSFTPQTTGLVKVKAVVNVYNNTAGDGVFVGLYNSSTELDSETLISSSANQQQIAYLYNEVLYTAPFSQQTYSIQFNAVSGGTAYAEIQEFTIEEVYWKLLGKALAKMVIKYGVLWFGRTKSLGLSDCL